MQTLGGSLGSCLANVGKYKSVGGFIEDLSKKLLLSTSLNFMIGRLPLLGYLLIIGGFSLSFYNIMRNQIKSGSKKMKDMGQMLLGTTSSLGTSLIGGFVGAAFIPIPILGVFIGSLVGGFIGSMSSNAFMNYVESKGFEEIIKNLKKSM